jgi:peptidoglycan/LPS O-acetylase OafA/YrhL
LKLTLIKSGSEASKILDLIRFIAAIIVCFYHGGFSFLPADPAVMIFFVLSGYFISSSVLKSMVNDNWSWGVYLTSRLTRLLLVLIPALLLTFFWDKLGILVYGNAVDPSNLSLNVFFGNLFFLQGVIVKTFGSNGPLWSLSYEFWYYILFPCVVLTFRSKKLTKRIFYGIVVIGISLFLGSRIMEYFLIWLCGTLIVLLKPIKLNDIDRKLRIGLLSLSFLLTIVSFKLLFIVFNITHPTPETNQFIPDVSVAVSFSLFLYLVLSAYNHIIDRGQKSSFLNSNICMYLAGTSYTLYLVHAPILHFALKWYDSFIGSPDILTKIAYRAAALTLILLYGWAISRLTEKHTDAARNIVLNLLFKRSRKPFKKAA